MMHLLVLIVQLLTISLVPGTTGQATQLVYDTEGHELRSNCRYCILPAEHRAGGGFQNYDDTGVRCTFLVGQSKSEGDNGFPVRIIPSSDGIVGVSSNVQSFSTFILYV